MNVWKFFNLYIIYVQEYQTVSAIMKNATPNSQQFFLFTYSQGPMECELISSDKY